MPQKRRMRVKRGSGKTGKGPSLANGAQETVTCTTSFLTGPSFTAASAFGVRLNPNDLGSERLIQYAAMFSLFRFKRIRMRIPPQFAGIVTSPELFLAGYTSVDEASATTPLDASNVSELDVVSPPMSRSLTTNTTFDIPQKALRGKEFDWYLCNGTYSGSPSPATLIASQGELWFGFLANETINVVIIFDVVCEFSDRGGGNGPPDPMPPKYNLCPIDTDLRSKWAQAFYGRKKAPLLLTSGQKPDGDDEERMRAMVKSVVLELLRPVSDKAGKDAVLQS